MQTIPAQRLHPVDLYHMIDWVREGWDDDELLVTPRLQRLAWHLEELPEPYRSEAMIEYTEVARARIAAGHPWLQALARMRRIVHQWGRTLPA